MIKKDNTVYVIAEIGGNHEGSFEKCKVLLKDAISSGADAVKFQIYTGDTLVNKAVDPDRVKHFDNFALKLEQYLELSEICKANGVDFLASVWSEDLIELFKDRMPFYKIGSGDMTAYPIIKKIANTKKPILISTGLSNMAEIENTVNYIYQCDEAYKDKGMLGILQCTSMYPIPNSEANLSVIVSIEKNFPNVTVGYSDHTEGVEAVEVAVALGAKIIEVHFTDDRTNKVFRDHKVSFTSKEIRRFICKTREIIEMMGDGCKQPTNSEIESGHTISFRRGLYPKSDFKKGHVFSGSDFISLRPCKGVSASDIELFTGKKCNRDLRRLEVIEKSDYYP
jgi:N,N'-diacetyllegionaminate synthase